jgi:hypothetical protein
LLGDVTTFSTALKKAVQDLNAKALDLQMGQPSVRCAIHHAKLIFYSDSHRPDAVTMTADLALATGFDYDDFLDVRDSRTTCGISLIISAAVGGPVR